jgi:hypothetical protein
MLQLVSDGLIDDVDRSRFMQYALWMNGARVLAVVASIPWWEHLGLL